MAKYYFVGSLLPELKIGMPSEIPFSIFDILLQLNLFPTDYNKTKVLRRLWDIENFRSYWKKEPLDERGNLDAQEVEEVLIDPSGLPSYMREFLVRYPSDEERLKHFSKLLASYFQEETKNATGFLHKILAFEREHRLVLAAFRAKKLGRDIAVELQNENPDEPFIAQLLALKDAPDFEPPEKYAALKEILTKYANSPMELHQAICEYVFSTIDTMVGLDPFTMDRILGYLIQLTLIEKWQELDRDKGEKIVDRFVKEKA